MAEKLQEKSCERFTAELASPAPIPGGGSVTALLGALSAALCAMAANLSSPRAKDPLVGEALKAAGEQAGQLRLRALAMIDADAEAFLPLSLAYGLPKDTPGRAETLRQLSLQAAEIPLEALRLCGEIVELLELLLSRASSLLQSDVGCAAAVCRAAVDCAAMNVWVNTGLFPEDPQVQEYEKEAKDLHETLLRRTDAVTAAVRERLVKEWP